MRRRSSVTLINIMTYLKHKWHPCFAESFGSVVLSVTEVVGDNGYNDDIDTGLEKVVRDDNTIRIVITT